MPAQTGHLDWAITWCTPAAVGATHLPLVASIAAFRQALPTLPLDRLLATGLGPLPAPPLRSSSLSVAAPAELCTACGGSNDRLAMPGACTQDPAERCISPLTTGMFHLTNKIILWRHHAYAPLLVCLLGRSADQLTRRPAGPFFDWLSPADQVFALDAARKSDPTLSCVSESGRLTT